MRTKHLCPVVWHGGKSPNKQSGRKIVTLLPPPTARQIYIEPCCGMLGILLQREPAGREIVSDLEEAVYHFWLAIRDRHDELSWLLDNTPSGERTYRDAQRVLESPHTDSVKTAWALCVVTSQTLHARTWAYKDDGTTRWGKSSVGYDDDFCVCGVDDKDTADADISSQSAELDDDAADDDDDADGDWKTSNYARIRKAHAAGGVGRKWRSVVKRCTSKHLADRMRAVELENLDATQLINDFKSHTEAVIYIDPPYSGSDNSAYRHSLSPEAIVEALDGVKARVAISGFPSDPYDKLLGWRKETFTRTLIPAGVGGSSLRTEVLWMNYPAVNDGTLFGGSGE